MIKLIAAGGAMCVLTLSFAIPAEAASINRPANFLGMVGYWTFDGKDMKPGVQDLSGQGNHGTISGQTSTTTRTGKIGQALFLDGADDHVNIPAASSINNLAAMSVSFWIKTDSFASCTNGNGAIIEKQTFAHGWLLNCYSTRYLGFIAYHDTGGASLGVLTNSTIPLGEWTHVVMSWDGDMSGANAKFYINGVDSTTVTSIGSAPRRNDSALPIHIGYNQYDGGRYSGLVDEVKLFNRAITISEVKALYTAGDVKFSKSLSPGTLSSGLLTHLTFDGKDMKPNIRDISGQGNHGMLVGQSSTSTTPGRIGQALSLDGSNDHVTVSDTVALRPGTGAWSLAAWIKPDDADRFAGILAKRDGDSFVQMMLTVGGYGGSCSPSASRQISFISYDSTNGGCVETTANVADGDWHHVVAVKNSNSSLDFTIYVDGVAASISTAATFGDGTSNISNTVPWLVGCQNTASNCFSGPMDDARIYNRALSASEVRQLYSMGAQKLNVSGSQGGSLTGLVGHWTFDGKHMTPNVRDTSGQGNHGNLAGQISTTTAPGKIGQALDMDGVDDSVSVTNASSLNVGTNDFTVSAWVKGAEMAASDVIVAKSNGGAAAADYGFLFGVFDTLQPTLYFATDAAVHTKIQGATTLQNGEWYHVLVSVDRDDMNSSRVYINGAADTTTVTNGGSNTGSITNSAGLSIGSESDGGFNWDGYIDDVRLYNRALSTSDVRQVYNLGR